MPNVNGLNETEGAVVRIKQARKRNTEEGF